MIKNCIIRIWEFYRDGFREMTLGRTLWMLILVKLFIMFFYPEAIFLSFFLKDKTDEEKQQYVGSELVNRSSNSIIK